MNADAQNHQRLLEARIQALEQLTRRIPSRFAGGGSVASPPIYFIFGGNVLPSSGGSTLVSGIARRTDSVLASELPNGTGGSSGDTVIVPAWPIPASMPLGTGVGKNVFTNKFAFLLNDANGAFPGDMPINRKAYVGGTINLDKVSGGITYRYVFSIILQGF